MSTPALFVARHAAVDVEGVCYGQSDVPTRLDAQSAGATILTQLARENARIDRVWTSPWRRTREPAACIASELGLPLTVDGRLSELAFGQWEGRAYAELERDAVFLDWMRDWRHAAPPAGERLDELVGRVRQWRSEALSRGEVALAITHAGVIRVLRADARRCRYEQVMGEKVEALTLERVP